MDKGKRKKLVRVKGRSNAPSLRKVQRLGPRRFSHGIGTESVGGSHLSAMTKTQVHLITHARSLFARKGFDGVSVKDVSDATKLNISLVSYHFNGKEGLYRACIEKFGKDCLEAVQRTLQPPKSLGECELRLSMFIDLMIDIFIKNPDASAMAFKEADMEARLFEDVFESTFIELFKTLISYFEASQRAGFIRKDMDPHTTASILFGSLSHFARMDFISLKFFGRTIKDSKHREKVTSHLKTLFAGSLTTKINA